MEQTTEHKIREAARDIFHKKGFDGARMQEIAVHAGINKGLLHYYFKSKEKLFASVFDEAFTDMISRIASLLLLDTPVEERLLTIVDHYMDLLMSNPDMPRFVVHELNKNPQAFMSRHITREARTAFAHFAASVEAEIKAKKIAPADPRHLFVNTISLIVFPFIARPLIQGITAMSQSDMKQLLLDRKAHIRAAIQRELAR